MIPQNASGVAAEIGFNLFDANTGNPITDKGSIGNPWVAGEIKLALPGGAFGDANVANIRNLGRGKYALQLTAAETAIAGMVVVDVDTTNGYRADSWTDYITSTGIAIAQGASGIHAEMLINLYDATDGHPILLHPWVAGELLISTPGNAFGNATVANIRELGRGKYALQLTALETGTDGRVEIDLDTTNGYLPHSWTQDVRVAVSATLQYRMRGRDGTLNRLVYWTTTGVDGTGASYAGPGPLTDIVAQSVYEVVG